MDILENIKSGAVFIADTANEFAESIAEKNRIRTRLNHMRAFIKNQNETKDQAFMELGRYYYENLREGSSPENEALCAVVDDTTAAISRASLKYMELLNLQNETKIRSDNADKLKKIVAEKAKEAAEGAKVQGAELSKKAKEAAAESAKKAKEAAAEGAKKAKELAAEGVQKAKDVAADLKEKAGFDKELFGSVDPEAVPETAEEAAEVFEEAAAEAKEEAAEVIEDAKEAAAQADDEVEKLIAAEQEKLKTAEVSAVSEAAPVEVADNEESPDSFDF